MEMITVLFIVVTLVVAVKALAYVLGIYYDKYPNSITTSNRLLKIVVNIVSMCSIYMLFYVGYVVEKQVTTLPCTILAFGLFANLLEFRVLLNIPTKAPDTEDINSEQEV